jgi:hypothetical protein
MSPKRSPVPDENERQITDARLVEIRDKAFAARRAADAQGGRASDLEENFPSDAPIPPTTAPEASAAPSAGIEERERRAAQEKLNALASTPTQLQISDAAKKLLFRGT